MNNLTPYQTRDDTWERVLQSFFGPLPAASFASANQAKIDVLAREDAFAISVELPGVAKDSIDVSVSGNEVRINAQVPEIKDANNANVTPLIKERRHGQISRTLVLPHDVDSSQAQAKYTNGVLELVLPFHPNSLPAKLSVE